MQTQRSLEVTSSHHQRRNRNNRDNNEDMTSYRSSDNTSNSIDKTVGSSSSFTDENDNENDQVLDSEVYTFTLKVILLQHVIETTPASSRRHAVPSSYNNNTTNPIAGPSTPGRLTGGGTTSTSTASGSSPAATSSTSNLSSHGRSYTLSALSLSDIFRSSSSSSSTSSSSPRYPERFVKLLEQRIESISRGSDKQYTDLLLRYTIGAFYGKFKDPKNARLIKETRKLEDLLMLFIATSTDVLRKRCSAGDEWKWRLEDQLHSFVDILESILKNNKELKHVPSELLVKLDTLKLRISANANANASLNNEVTGNGNGTTDGDGKTASSTTRGSMDYTASPLSATAPMSQSTVYTTSGTTASSHSISWNIADIPAARQLAALFEIDSMQLQKDVNHHRKHVTEKNAFLDLKQCINLISVNASFPACKEDFQSEESYNKWRTLELSDLQEEMLNILKRSPEVAKSDNTTNGTSTGNTTAGDIGSSGAGISSAHSSARNSVVTEAGEAYVGRRISRGTSLPIAEHFASLSTTSASSLLSPVSESSHAFLDSPIAMTNATSESGHTATATAPGTVAAEEDSTNAHGLVFVPNFARASYARLLELMLSYDLAAMADLDPSEEVSLRILSSKNQDILKNCSTRWRIPETMQFVSFLKEMSRKYSAGEMPVVECVTEALNDFDSVNNRISVQDWPIADRDTLLQVISQLFDALLRGFYETYAERLPQQAAASVYDAIVQLSDLPLFEQAIPSEDLKERLDQLSKGIQRVSDFFYDTERSGIFSQDVQMQLQQQQVLESEAQSQAPRQPSVDAFFELLSWIKTSAKKFDKQYRAPLFSSVDIPGHFLERVTELYLRDLSYKLQQLHFAQKSKPLYTTPNEGEEVEQPVISDGQVMAFYRGVTELLDMHKAFCPNATLSVSLNEQFEPYILRWLVETDSKTLTWVRNAINLDDFKPDDHMETDKHTSSIVDLIASCKGALQFVTDLNWPDEYQSAMFITKLAATISKAIEQYCIAIEKLFMFEVMPSKRDSGAERDERTSAWITRAKALYQDKKLEAFIFQPTSCLKLNNIHAARELLDKMYTSVDADRVAAISRTRAPAVPPKETHAQRNLFTVKVVLGEGLTTADGVSRVDPFVTLSDERGMRIAKTRTLYETKEPRWAETFDISVEGKMWIAATVWNRNLVDEHEMLGRTFLALDPAVFGDFLPHDLWQDLGTTGRLLLRVSMEGEKDDIQFFFGRAFRSLKRAENDMTRVIVDKISPFIRSCISTSSLKSLLKQGGLAYLKDLNLERAFERARLENGIEGVKNLKNLIKARDPNAPQIPLPPSFHDNDKPNKPPPTQSGNADKKKAAILTDAEVEEPLGPLLEYLDQTLETFRKYLSESAWQVVMTKIWKEVISVVEGLLVPPLSDQPTDMKPLTDKEVDIVFKWLKFLTDFFHADGSGVPIEDLRNPRYRSVMLIRFYYDWSTDQLMEESVRLTNQQLMAPINNNKALSRSKSVYQQRNLGTIKQRKQEKQEESDSGAAEMVMRILRMRADAIDFLQQQMGTLNLVQEKQRKPTRLLGSIRGRGRGKASGPGRSGNIRHRLNNSFSQLPPIPSSQGPEWKQYR